MSIVKVNTSDIDWIKRHNLDADAVAIGKDITGVMYFTAQVKVEHVEHTRFACAGMIRFDLGPDAPRDHARWAMYPESYLIEDVPQAPLDGRGKRELTPVAQWPVV